MTQTTSHPALPILRQENLPVIMGHQIQLIINRSREKILSDAALIQEVSNMAENKGKAELMILELMRKYTFNLSRLRELLGRKAN